MRTMDMLLRTSVFLWISLGLLSVPEKSEAFLSNDNPALCEFVFRNVCLEFVGQSTTWSQARSSCENQGGELLRVMTNPIKVFLSNIIRKEKIIDFTWWLGEGVQGDNQGPTKTENGDVSKDFCTYMKLNPLQLKISDCNQRRGFLCTHILQSPSSSKSILVPSHATRSRLKRSISAMAGNVADIKNLLKEAEGVLRQMETTVGEPTSNDMKQFIEYLMAGTKKMSKEFALQNNDTISHIINCSIAILRVSMDNCYMDTNPNPTTLFDNVAEIFQTIAVLIGTSDTQQVIIQHSTGTVYLASRKANEFSNLVLGSESDGAFIKFPDFKELSPQLEKYDTVTAQMSAFLNNPHPSDTISGMVCNIILSDGSANINLSNLNEMIEIFLPHPEAAPLLSNTAVLEQDKKLVTLINITDPQATVFFTVEHNSNVSLLLTLAHGSPPNPQNSRNRTIFRSAGIHHWIITPEMFNLTAGLWYVDTRLNESKEVSGLTIKISSFMSQCLYWHEVRQTWSTEGCRVGEKTTPQKTQCLCNHLTLFGSSFFVMPNNVDISRTTELFATVNENYVVLALLCAFYGLYLITVLWAAYVDRRARSKRKMTLLEDNHPGAQYNYLIGIQTGHRKSAGTSANVTAQLIGSEGESTRHILTDPDKPVFERGSVDMFLLATPFPLGEVQNLKLQHDNSGDHPSWYINKVTIQDLQTRHVVHFFCNCWLSFDRGDNMTKKTFNAAKNNEIASFRNIFQSRTSTGFRDEHIWVSIVDPPSRSPFTRAQRVSCCMSLLLCTMAINIAFWNLPVDESSPVLFSLGSLQITWQEIIVGVECGLLMFPINILIITIFRSIRPRIVSKSTKDNDQENLKPLAVTIPSFLKDTEEVVSQIGMCPTNKMPQINSLISIVDLWPAFDHVNELIQRMQGESESTSHWVYSSKFVLAGLCHLHMCLEKLDGKNFNCPEDYQHALNIINVMVRKAEMVFSIHLANCPPPAKKKKKRSVGCLLPWWCVFLGWFLLLSIAGISTFFTLLYGFEYGKEKSIKWVISLGMSLFQSIFILQPLKVIGIAVFFALLLKPVAVEESEEVEQVLSEQRDKCRRYSGKDTL